MPIDASNLWKYCKLMEGLSSISWKEQNFMWQFWPDLTLNAYDNSVKVRHFFQLSVCFNCRFCENTADFQKFKHYKKLKAGNRF